jgi:hypothetical protein
MFFVESIDCQNPDGDEHIKIHANSGPVFKIVDDPPVRLMSLKRHPNALFFSVNKLKLRTL